MEASNQTSKEEKPLQDYLARVMPAREALTIWYQACHHVHGCDAEGNDSTTYTALGGIALAWGVPINSLAAAGARPRVAAFLRAWADVIEKG